MRTVDMQKIIGADTLSLRNGMYTARWSFFYTHGKTGKDYADRLQKAIPNAEIVDFATIWKPFIGGAPVARQSHFRVDFKLRPDNDVLTDPDLDEDRHIMDIDG